MACNDSIEAQTSGMLEYMHRAKTRNASRKERKADKYRTALQEIDARVLEMEIAAEQKEVWE